MRPGREARHPTQGDRSHPSLSLRFRVCHSTARAHARLLGPCFKTGRTGCRHLTGDPKLTPAYPTTDARRSASTANSPRQLNRTRGPGADAAAVLLGPARAATRDGPKRCPKATTLPRHFIDAGEPVPVSPAESAPARRQFDTTERPHGSPEPRSRLRAD